MQQRWTAARAVLTLLAMSKFNIVIAERGWVYVGRTHRAGDQLVIEDCHNIRRWGTTKGLGELAQSGPTSSTVMDHYGVVRVHVLAVAGTVDCNDDIWTKAIGLKSTK